ncbi:hypothetical protein QE152_g15776 [Popillia japonica]|uniref:Uncharacterized protein n=1 Tax=Popillia japonica TaxID=7064 RepID=A0AAW1L8I2_POPJA
MKRVPQSVALCAGELVGFPFSGKRTREDFEQVTEYFVPLCGFEHLFLTATKTSHVFHQFVVSPFISLKGALFFFRTSGAFELSYRHHRYSHTQAAEAAGNPA